MLIYIYNIVLTCSTFLLGSDVWNMSAMMIKQSLHVWMAFVLWWNEFWVGLSAGATQHSLTSPQSTPQPITCKKLVCLQSFSYTSPVCEKATRQHACRWGSLVISKMKFWDDHFGRSQDDYSIHTRPLAMCSCASPFHPLSLEALEHLRHDARGQQRDVFFFDNGDINDGTGLSASAEDHVEYLAPVLRMAGYDALNVGNHELYQRNGYGRMALNKHISDLEKLFASKMYDVLDFGFWFQERTSGYISSKTDQVCWNQWQRIVVCKDSMAFAFE